MTTETTHLLDAPWRGVIHSRPGTGLRTPAEVEAASFRVGRRAAGELALVALLAGWALLEALFLIAVA